MSFLQNLYVSVKLFGKQFLNRSLIYIHFLYLPHSISFVLNFDSTVELNMQTKTFLLLPLLMVTLME